MYFVYLLRNKKSNEFYYGYTSNLEQRIREHNNPDEKWKLVYYEAYTSELDARQREKKLKHYGQSRNHLKNRLCNSLQL